jgi:hypothetical protein
MAITPQEHETQHPRRTDHQTRLRNSAKLAFFTELTGLPADELVNWLLADYLQLFTPDDDSGYVGRLLKFKDRPGASSTANARVNVSRAPQIPAATTHPFCGRKPITPFVRMIEPVDLICLDVAA